MRRPFWPIIIAIGLISCSSQQVQSRPAIFCSEGFAQAKTRAIKEQKVFVADFTATWCGPCKKMDETTWSDPIVQSWMAENAVAVQVDVDAEHDVASMMQVDAMPTIVVFLPTKEKEFERKLGYQTTAKLLTWLTAAKNGERAIDFLRQKVATLDGKGGKDEVDAKYALAAEMAEAGEFFEATCNYVWLWDNIPKEDPAMIGVRDTFMVHEMTSLAKRYLGAMIRFRRLRNDAENTNRNDWILLNEVTGEDEKSLAWFDSVKNDSKQQANLEGLYALRHLLIQHNRYGDAVIFFKDPTKRLQQDYESSQEAKKIVPQMDLFAHDAAEMYRCFVAAGREAEADKLVDATLKLEDNQSLRLDLFAAAVHAGQPLQGLRVLTKGRETQTAIASTIAVLLAGTLIWTAYRSRKRSRKLHLVRK